MQPEKQNDQVKPDLKHDTMEYAASTDGDDVLDTDTEAIDDGAITADELDLLEDESFDGQAAALNTAETDSLADEDNFINETKVEEEYDDIEQVEDDDQNHHRK